MNALTARLQRSRRRAMFATWRAGAACAAALSPALARIALAQAPANAASSSAAAPADLPSVSPFDFGAVGDGIADDTKACNAAAARAQAINGQLVFPAGTFRISNYIVVRAGVRRVLGTGGVILCANTSNEAGLLLGGKASGNATNVRGCKISGLKIDCGNAGRSTVHAIYGQNVSDCEISGNHVFNIVNGYGVLLRCFSVGGDEAVGNLITGNRIERRLEGEPAGDGIHLDATLMLDGKVVVASDYWLRNHQAVPVQLANRKNIIRSNVVIGGYYGIFNSETHDGVIESNRLVGNTRSMSIANGCTGNLITNNECLESLSSGINLAYGSSRNTVRANHIETNRARGEGLLQAYVGASDNTFEDNTVVAGPKATPKYFIYSAVHADRNQFLRNKLSGPCARAYIALETAFDSKSSDPSHYAYKVGVSTRGMATRGMTGVVVRGNTIEATSNAPVFYLGQLRDEDGAYGLADCVIEGNTVKGESPNQYLRLVEQAPGELARLRFDGNNFPSGADSTKFVAPRGARNFDTASPNVASFIKN